MKSVIRGKSADGSSKEIVNVFCTGEANLPDAQTGFENITNSNAVNAATPTTSCRFMGLSLLFKKDQKANSSAGECS